MAGTNKIQQKPKKLLQAWLVYAQLIIHVAYNWLLLFLPACIDSFHCTCMNLLQSSSADGIAVVAGCCQSMSSVQYACNSTVASAPLVLHYTS